MGTLWQDVKYGARMLLRSPGFTAVAVLTLALGIGANSAIFQLMDAVRLRRLPVKDPQELVDIGFDHQGWYAGHLDGRYPILTNALWEQIRDRQQAFSGAFAWGTDQFNLSRGGEARYAQGLWVSGDFFRVLGVRPQVGRVFSAADDRRGCGTPDVVISYAFWQHEFGGRADTLGAKLTLNGQPVEIVGITPPSFFGVEVGRNFDVAVPLCAEPQIKGERSNLEVRNAWWLAAMGRLKPGWTAQQASAHLAAISPAIFETTVPSVYQEELAKHYREFKLRAAPAAGGISTLRDTYTDPLWLLIASTGLVLLIACANLANLLLARASAREREIAVRVALGASRGRLVRQLLAESALLAAVGALAEILFAEWVIGFLVALLSTQGDPLFIDLRQDWGPLLFTTWSAALACILFGLPPALRATRTDPGSVMKAAGRGLTAGHTGHGLRRLLVVSQVALSMVLLVTALLFTRSLNKLLTLDAGFRQDGILLVNLDLTRLGLPEERRQAYKAELAAQVRSLPGVESAVEALSLPWGDYHNNVVRGEGPEATARVFQTNLNWVAPGYFRTLEIPLLAGRDFDAQDTSTSLRVAIVNEAFARRLLEGSPHQDESNKEGDTQGTPGRSANPVGKILFMRSFGDSKPVAFEIIGLVKNSKYYNLREEFPRTAFFPRSQQPHPDALGEIVVRSDASLAGLIPSIRNRLADASPEIMVEFHVLKTQLRESLLPERLMAILSGSFGFLAAVLAVIGLYGVMTYLILRRSNEIGIRMALGADPGTITRMILGEAVHLLVIGLGVGLVLALLAARAVSALVFGLKPHDPLTIAMAVGLLSAAAVVASYVPARRAARVDPMVALRYE